MKIALVGDVMLGREVGEEIARGDRSPTSFWGDTLEILGEADLVVGNLECAITERRARWTRTPKVFHFRAPPAAVDVLAAAGFDAVSLANNHLLDYREEGLLDTLGHLDRAGIARAGAGRDRAEAERPAVVEATGARLGLVALTDNEPGWAATADRPGVWWAPIGRDPEVLDRVEASVHRAREAGADVVALSLHWGPNMVERPPDRFRAFAREAVARGVDVIHGHSAHVFQGVEVVDGAPVLYDLGDFLDDYAVDPRLRNDRSVVALVGIEAGRVASLELVPVRLRLATVEIAQGEDRAWIAARLRALSAELGTRVEEAGDRLRVRL